jgi:hypothetical protein
LIDQIQTMSREEVTVASAPADEEQLVSVSFSLNITYTLHTYQSHVHVYGLEMQRTVAVSYGCS